MNVFMHNLRFRSVDSTLIHIDMPPLANLPGEMSKMGEHRPTSKSVKAGAVRWRTCIRPTVRVVMHM